MLNFKEFFEQNTVGTHNDYATNAIVSDENPSKIDGHALAHGIIPSVTRTGTIEYLDRNSKDHSKLITILLSDKSKLYLTWDEFNRIRGLIPEKGRRLTVTFQRRDDDHSSTPSKIQSILCH